MSSLTSRDLFRLIHANSVGGVRGFLKESRDLADIPHPLHHLSPLQYACQRETNPEILTLLLRAGADPNRQDIHGTTALHYLISNPILDRLSIYIHVLKKQGLDLNIQDHAGQTALYKACQNGRPYAARCLIDVGANIDIPENSGKTPLLVLFGSQQETLFQYLLEKGARLTSPYRGLGCHRGHDWFDLQTPGTPCIQQLFEQARLKKALPDAPTPPKTLRL